MKSKRSTAAMLVVGIAIAFGAWFAHEHANKFATAMGCVDKVINKEASPDGRYASFIFKRECGATAPDSVQINVQPADRPFDSDEYKPFFVIDGAPSISVRWADKVRLTVVANTTRRIYRQEDKVGGVRIQYELDKR